MSNDKGFVYLIQPAELVGTYRYKIGYSKNNDIYKFRKDYKKGSRFLDIYESEHSPLLVREIRNNFNTKFKLVAGRTYYEGNENDIKKDFNEIINTHTLANNINIPKLVIKKDKTNNDKTNNDKTNNDKTNNDKTNNDKTNNDKTNNDNKIILYTSNSNCNSNSNCKSYMSSFMYTNAMFNKSNKYITDDNMINHTYMNNIIYGVKNQEIKKRLELLNTNNNKSYYDDVYVYSKFYNSDK